MKLPVRKVESYGRSILNQYLIRGGLEVLNGPPTMSCLNHVYPTVSLGGGGHDGGFARGALVRVHAGPGLGWAGLARAVVG